MSDRINTAFFTVGTVTAKLPSVGATNLLTINAYNDDTATGRNRTVGSGFSTGPAVEVGHWLKVKGQTVKVRTVEPATNGGSVVTVDKTLSNIAAATDFSQAVATASSGATTLTLAKNTFTHATVGTAIGPFAGAGTAALVTGTTHASSAATGATTLTMSSAITLKKGDAVSGTGIAAGTQVVLDVTAGTVLALDKATTGAVAAGATLTFYTRTVALAAPDANIKPGQPVTGVGLAAGTTVVSYSSVGTGSVTISAPITAALSSTAIEFEPRTNSVALAAQSLTHGAASLSGATELVVTASATVKAGMAVTGTNVAAGTKVKTSTTGTTIYLDTPTSGIVASSATITVDPLIVVGQSVSGTGIAAGTTVAAGSGGTTLKLSAILTADVAGAATLTFSDTAFTQTASALTSAATVTLTAANGKIKAGMYISDGGASIPAGTTVLAYTAGATSLTMSALTTGAINANTILTFNEYQTVDVGQFVSGPGLVYGTRVTNVAGAPASTITLSDALTAALPANPTDLTFGSYEEVVVPFGIDAVDVTRVGPTQSMGYTWSVTFVNKTVGADQKLFRYREGSGQVGRCT